MSSTNQIVGMPSGLESLQAIKDALQSVPSEAARDAQFEKSGESGYGPIHTRYYNMVTVRQPALDEARRMSESSIPCLYPPSGVTDVYIMDSANQSLVAEGTQNLAYALTTTICPPNAKFFAHKMLPALAAAMENVKNQQQDDAAKFAIASVVTQTNNDLINRDDKIRQFVKTTNDVETFNSCMVHDIVAGQAVYAKPTLESSKIYTLENYVAEFDSSGEMVEVIVQDFIHPSKFSPEDLKMLFGVSDLAEYEAREANIHSIPVYTRQVRRWDHWEIQVEIAGKRFSKMEGKEELDSPPFMVLPFFLFPNHKYAVGWLTYNKGIINQFENVSLAMNEMIKLACDYHVMVPPESKLTQAELSMPGPKYHFSTTAAVQIVIGEISKNMAQVQGQLSAAEKNVMRLFLMDQAIQRDAERVTAEEIRTLIQGLKKLWGGVFLSIARRWQHPYINRVDRLMVRAGKLPQLPPGTTELVLTAGVTTLENAEELQAQDQWFSRIGANPQWLPRINENEFAERTANLLMLNLDNMWLDDDQYQEKMGVSQLVGMAQQLGPQGPGMVATILQQIQANPQMLQTALQGASQSPEGQQTQTPLPQQPG